MTGLVACLNVEVDKVVGLQGIDGCLCLALVVGVPKSRGTGHVDDTQSGILADAANEVDSRNDGTASDNGETFHQGLHLGPVSPTPRPDAVGRVHAAGHTFLVEGMVLEQLLALQHQVTKQCGRRRSLVHPVLGLGHILAPRLQGDVVRRSAMDVLVAALHDQQVAILDAGVEVDAVGVEMLFQVINQDVALLRLQASARVILQQVALEAHKVATQCQVIVGQGYAYAGSLQGAPSLVDEVLVVAQDAAVGHFAARMESVGDGLEHATTAIAGQEVEVWRIGILQEGLSSQLLDRPVGHAVSKYNQMFHQAKLIMSANTPAAVTLAPAP